MDIAVIGAAGSVGRSVCQQLLAQQILQPEDRLQLVGRRGGSSETGIYGLRIDLLDAYATQAPIIETVLDIDSLNADIIVMVAGETPPPDPSIAATRDVIATTNLPVFEYYAKAIASHQRGHELVIIQSNPVELAVDVFSRHIEPRRVVGAGAYSDSLRFRREIGTSFRTGYRRPLVTGYMLGEHGPNVVPIWSSVSVHGLPQAQVDRRLAELREGRPLEDLPNEAGAARNRLGELLAENKAEAAFDFVHALPPDVRALVKPWFAHWSGRTSTVTAHSVVDLIDELDSGHRVVLPLQVATTAAEWPGIDGVLGLPVDIDITGWHHTVALDLADDERTALTRAAESVNERLRAWQS